MKRWLLVGLVIAAVGIGILVWRQRTPAALLKPVAGPTERPLEKYSFERLRERRYSPSEIKFDRVLTKNAAFSTWAILYQSDGKRVSGVADIPNNLSLASPGGILSAIPAGMSVVIMVHGFADQKEYYPGFGTERVAAVLASNGYVTLAPDFLGFGQSDPPSTDVFEERFETYTAVLNLIASVENVCRPGCKLGLWGHSNGGQVILSVLEISGKAIPTVLWNPVSKPFPYSILYYTDDFDDHGKALRRALARFERDYDVEKYSIPNFLAWIAGPIFLQQGAADQSVPPSWSEGLYKSLVKAGKDASYKVYPGADHNMIPLWNQAVADDLDFYRRSFGVF